MKEYEELVSEIETCRRCRLCESRTNTVPGEGALDARLMVIGEGPGAEEDKQGRPFVGLAGRLLDNMLDSIGLERKQVYIANIVKCRPPKNRAPKEDEADACIGFLERQIEIINPDIILLLGATALNYYLSKELKITKARGVWYTRDGRDVIATFHPAALLRDPSKKPISFEDMLEIKKKLNGIKY